MPPQEPIAVLAPLGEAATGKDQCCRVSIVEVYGETSVCCLAHDGQLCKCHDSGPLYLALGQHDALAAGGPGH